MEIMSSPWKNAPDSPSRQLLYELSRLGVAAQENFYARLDRENREREALHRDALAAAAVAHERIRRNAVLERERLELQLQAERRRRDEEDQRELERRRQEKAELEIAEKRREVERVRLAEIAEKRIADARKAEAAAAEKKKQEREAKEAEIARQLKEEQDAKAKTAEAARQAENEAKEVAARTKKAKELAAAFSQPSNPHAIGKSPATQPNVNPEREAEHQRYLQIHRNLKELRKLLTTRATNFPEVKQHMGEMRREIKKSVGQLTEGKGANRGPLQQIMSVLRRSIQLNQPKIDLNLFLAATPESLASADPNVPSLLVYLLNIFAKAIVSQFIDEASVSPRIADPIGTIASHIFSLTDFRWQGLPLIDILIAKMHVVCPILWGIYGDETTPQGKARIGWWREEKDGPWVSEHRHKERMTGLGAGFAAIALRNYEKARTDNPYPNTKYWQSLAYIINTPAAEVTTTHFVVLKAMIENYETKFIDFFGNAALAVLRKALIDFPAVAVQQGMAAKALTMLVEVLRKDKKLVL